MRFLILCLMVAMTNAQRPSYAGTGPIGRPGLANRFKDDSAPSSTVVSVENRVGEDGSTPKIPVDARGDVDLVNTLNTWEREHQPFWLLNADHIEKARNTTRGNQQISNRNDFNTQNSQGSQTNSQGNNGGNQESIVFNQNRLSDRENTNNNRDRNWMYGRPSQGDVRPVYEAPERFHGGPERFPSNQGVRLPQGQTQNGGSQKKLRFHYEMNRFP